MKFHHSKLTARRCTVAALGIFCCSALGVVFAAEPPPAGDKVQFSDPLDDFQIPTREVDDPLAEKPFESLNRDSSVSGVIAPNLAPPNRTTPNGAATGRLMELYQRRLDEKKNWIYQRPGDTEAQPTLEETFGVRDTTKLNGSHGRSVLVEFFEGPARKPAASRPIDASRNALDRTGFANSWEAGSPSMNPGAGTGSLTGTPRSGLDENFQIGGGLNKPGFSVQNGFVVPDAIRPDASLDPGYRVGRGRDADQLSHADEFRKLLVIQNGINPLAAGFDPINLHGDTTRQDLNPVTPLGLDTPLVGAGILAGAGASSTTVGHDSSFLGSSATLVGSSSLDPAVPTPSASSRQLRQPTVLEMPRRKF